jgi:hypothetical protein
MHVNLENPSEVRSGVTTRMEIDGPRISCSFLAAEFWRSSRARLMAALSWKYDDFVWFGRHLPWMELVPRFSHTKLASHWKW